ncbi:putative ribonuclease H-like domain-containing protein [Tanacetum coccineum]
MMDQEKEATKKSYVVRKEFESQCNRKNLSGKATKASSTNSFNTVSTPVNTASASRTYNDAGSSFVPLVQNTGIFGSAYDDEDLDTYNSPYADQVMGAEADFNNMEPSAVNPQKYQALEGLKCWRSNARRAASVQDSEGLDTNEPTLWQKAMMDVKDDIIFGSTKKSLCTDFKQIMHKRFQMSSMGELTFFLGLQVKQKEDGIFISQDKYVGEILKKFGFSSIRTANTPMETNKALTKDEDGKDVDIHLYSDYAGASLDRKSTTGGCQFLGSRLISWQCKKQTVVANSTTEAEYIAASHCCGQNPVYHSKTKHIEIRHHFIRDSYEKKLIEMVKIHTDYNVVDLLIKAFDVTRYRGLYTNELLEALFEEKLYGTMCINAVDYTTWILRMECKSCQNAGDSVNTVDVTPPKMGHSGICFRERYFIVPLHQSEENDL